MTRYYTVKKARKAYPKHGIKKGESYYWWKFRYGPRHLSKTLPRPSQLTSSSFMSQALELNERLEDITSDEGTDADFLESEVGMIAEEVRSLGEEEQGKFDNMPDALQGGPTGELLEGRAQACEEWADNLEGIDFEMEIGDLIDEIRGCQYEGE